MVRRDEESQAEPFRYNEGKMVLVNRAFAMQALINLD